MSISRDEETQATTVPKNCAGGLRRPRFLLAYCDHSHRDGMPVIARPPGKGAPGFIAKN